MGTRYMVSVVRIDDVDGTEYGTKDTTLFEATMTDPSRLARFAPVEVLETLASESGAPVAITWPATEPTVPVAEEAPMPEPATGAAPEKPKRTRRTKVEMDAARAASEARLNGEPEPNLEPAAEPAAAAAPVDVTAPNPWAAAAVVPPFNPFQ